MLTAAGGVSTAGAEEPDEHSRPRRAVERLGPRHRRALLLIVLSALALRVGWAVPLAEPPSGGDTTSYFVAGRDIAAGRGYRANPLAVVRERFAHPTEAISAPPSAFFPIGWPAALGALFWTTENLGLPNDTDALALEGVLLNAVLGTAIVVLTFAIARRFFDPTVALLAAAIVAVEPNLVFEAGMMRVEPAATATLMLALLVLVRDPWAPDGPSVATTVVGGLLIGVATLVRPNVFVLVALLPLAVWVSRLGWRRAVARGAILLGCAAVVIAPWTIRNIVEMHSPVLVSTSIGDTLCMGRQPHATGQFLQPNACDLGFAKVPFNEREVERYRKNTSRAVSWVVHHPVSEVGQWFSRMMWANRDDHDGLAEAADHFSNTWLSGLSALGDGAYFVILAFAIVGARHFARRSDGRRLFLLLTTISLMLVPLVTFGDPRYKVPAVPLLAILGAPALYAAWQGTRGTRISGGDAGPPPTDVVGEGPPVTVADVP